MRQFTEAEKLQLQTKIDDKEQHSQTPGKLDGKNDGLLQRESRARRDGTLEVILFLTALSVILLLWSRDNIGFNFMPFDGCVDAIVQSHSVLHHETGPITPSDGDIRTSLDSTCGRLSNLGVL